jgi:glycerophosphoryl diester phosphodiesterase
MIIAHRGESALAPENTLSAINLAWEMGDTAVEIDIHLTADNKIVVLHDPHTGRTGTQRLTVRKSMLKDLRAVDVGVKKGPEWRGEKIPELWEVLQTIPENCILVIEIKCGKDVIPFLAGVIRDMDIVSSRIEIISYRLDILCEMKKLFPGLRMLWLLDLDYYLPSWLINVNLKKLLAKVLACNLDGVDAWAGKDLDENFVREFKNSGLSVYAWTVNEVELARELLSYGVDAITTDNASSLKKRLSDPLI